jgi:hypothetical protein
MPLYEHVVLTRCGNAKGSAAIMRSLAQVVFKNGGNVREIKVLGDRILTKLKKGKIIKFNIIAND